VQLTNLLFPDVKNSATKKEHLCTKRATHTTIIKFQFMYLVQPRS